MTVAREPKSEPRSEPKVAGADKPAARPDAPRAADPLDRRDVQLLQGAAGNAAVSRLLVQRLREGPSADPKFTALRRDVRAKQQRMSAHKPAKAEAGAAHAASKAPADDALAQAKVAQSGDMAAAKPGGFDKVAFVKAVNAAIAAQAPKNYDEAEKLKDKPSQPPAEVAGQVAAGKQQSAAAIAGATGAPPDQSRAKVTAATPLAPAQPAATPAAPNAADAIPDKAPPEATDLSDGPRQVTTAMAQENVTQDQLDHSNEPSFHEASAAKKDGEQHAAATPPQLRTAESATLAGAKQHAAGQGAAGVAAMGAAHQRAATQVDAGKHSAKGLDEAKRAEVTGKLQKVFDTCKTEVEQILSSLDKKVDEQFTKEEKSAHDAFTADYTRRVEDYKDKRYSGLIGAGRWVKDKFAGLPAEMNAFYDQSRTLYTTRMQTVVSNIADTIGTELGKAKQRIATGRTELQAAIAQLPKDQQAIGQQAAQGFAAKFDELTSSVDAKGEELVQTLATKYTEALHAVDDQIAAEKEKNKGLIAKAMNAVGGVIKTILELKNLLLGVLAKAATAVMGILKDPIAFLGHLVSAVGAGLHNFLANIGTHLNKGLVGWLLGALTGAGLTLPGKFNLQGIIVMIASLLGLTWSFVRGRIVSKGVPDKAIDAAEKAAPLVGKIKSDGVGGIWKTIAGKVGDLKANLFGKITSFLIPAVLVAGITWIISLLNPASAFIKACKMIVDIVMFIVERGAQIVTFVNAVLDAVIAIAVGATGGVPALIENALAVSIPVLIGALAAILGLSGIAEKVKKFFQSLSKPVMKAVDWIVDKITTLAKKLWAKLKAKFGGKKDKDGSPDAAVTPRPIRLTVLMDGARHTLTANPGAAPRMASVEGPVRDKLARATASLKERDPQTEEEMNALVHIEELDGQLQAAASGLNARRTAEAQLAFDRAAQNLKMALQSYATAFHRSDIAAISGEVTIAQALRRAEHRAPANYAGGRHWRGTTDPQRSKASENKGPGQFLAAMTASRVAELERDTLSTGRVVIKGSGTFHAFKQYGEQIGWANGDKAFWLRAELTGVDPDSPTPGGSIHSHPR